MIVPTKTIVKDRDLELDLMVFPNYEENKFEFHLVEIYRKKEPILIKAKTYSSPLKIEEIAKEFGVKVEDVKEIVDKLYS